MAELKIDTTPVIMEAYSEMVSMMESPVDVFKAATLLDHNLRLLHAAMGCVTEAGELMDQMKKVLAYGKELDNTNIIEELGDMLWYVQLACNVLGITLFDVMKVNSAKLHKRYPDKFTRQAALNRDLDAERQVLDDHTVHTSEHATD
jgi:NTP pyrophosphatase (non-canonical NTP hydrolase)